MAMLGPSAAALGLPLVAASGYFSLILAVSGFHAVVFLVVEHDSWHWA